MIQINSILKMIILAITLAGACSYLQSQETIDALEIGRTVDSLAEELKRNYVFPEIAEEISLILMKNKDSGLYDQINSVHEFAARLTKDIRLVNNDRHLTVSFNPEGVKRLRQPEDMRREPSREMKDNMRRDNYGFHEVKILEGNIGYIDLRGFYHTSRGGETATAAMNFLSGADAIIFDLRSNGGGSPSMIQLLTSYLYSNEDNIHLNNFYFRPNGETTQTWTLPHVPGRRNPDADVYVLTSSRTFSAAEEFTYNIKNLKRGTIIGETTGGGAHPGGTSPIADRFTCFVPNGRAINPITHTNWEGTGVTPHIEIDQGKALDKAHLTALDKLMEKCEDQDQKKYFRWFKTTLEAKYNPIHIDANILKSYAGKFSFRSLLYENGVLYYQREGNNQLKLSALSPISFTPEGHPEFKLTVELSNGKVIALLAETVSGYSERLEKENKPKLKP